MKKKAAVTEIQSNSTSDPTLSQSKSNDQHSLQSDSVFLTRDIDFNQSDKRKEFQVERACPISSRDSHSVQSESPVRDSDNDDVIALLPSLTQRLANIRLQSENKGNSPIDTEEKPVFSEGATDYKSKDRKQEVNNGMHDEANLDDRSCSGIKDNFNQRQTLPNKDKRKPEIREKVFLHADVCTDNKEKLKKISFPNDELGGKLFPNHPNNPSIKENLNDELTLNLSSTPCFVKKKVNKSLRESFIDDLFLSEDDDSLLDALNELEQHGKGECIKDTSSSSCGIESTSKVDDDSLLDALCELQQHNKEEYIKDTSSSSCGIESTSKVDDDSLLDALCEIQQHNEGDCMKDNSSPSCGIVSTPNVVDDCLSGVPRELQQRSSGGGECINDSPSPPCCINISTPNVEYEQPVLKDVWNNSSQLSDSILADKDVFLGTPLLGYHPKRVGCQGDKKNLNAAAAANDFEQSLRRKLNLTVEYNTVNFGDNDEDSGIATVGSAHAQENGTPLTEESFLATAALSPLCLADRLKARFRHAR